MEGEIAEKREETKAQTELYEVRKVLGKLSRRGTKEGGSELKKQHLQLHLFNGRKQKATRRFKSACSAAKFNRLRHFDRWLFYLRGETFYESRRPQGDGKRWIRTEVGSGFTSDYFERKIASVAKRGAWGIMERREDSYVGYVDLIFYDNYLGGVP